MARNAEIIRALRCTSSSEKKPEGFCLGCRYLVHEEIPGLDVLWDVCDVDRIAIEAADALEKMEGKQ